MYSRSFFTDDKNPPTPPENYSGTALSEDEPLAEEHEECNASAQQCGCPPLPHEKPQKDESAGIFSKFFGQSGGIFGFLGGEKRGFLSHIGTEEILIIAVAMFLLFSKEGDKECAVMLLLLLVV